MLDARSFFKNNNGMTRKGRILLVAVVMLLSFAALSVWHFMPIYPDEIAFRTQLGRYIQDQGMVRGLYALCTSNIKETPLIFAFPAWILSSLDLAFSPVTMRMLPFVSALATMFFAICYIVRGTNPFAALLVTGAFLGVAGSGLVMARYEYMQVINILGCFLVLLYLDLLSQRTSLRYALLALLILSSLLSVYSHIQGLLFLPLTIYLAYQIVVPQTGKLRALVLIVLLFVLITATGIVFQHSSCVEYPAIEKFWAAMSFSRGQLGAVNLLDWLTFKLDKYQNSFIYKISYTSRYLPGVDIRGVWEEFFLTLLNAGIKFVVIANLIFTFLVAIGYPFLAFLKIGSPHKNIKSWPLKDIFSVQLVVPVLLALPVVFLFFYDSAHNFYRSFFLNFVAAILLAIYFSRISFSGIRMLTKFYFVVCSVVVVASLLANTLWFKEKLGIAPGYEGPSLSLHRDWKMVENDVKSLAQDCGMNLSNGKIILDDMTYDSLKHYPAIYPATYLSLQSGIAHIEMEEVIAKIRPNYAIAMCSLLHQTKIGYQHQRGELCCRNFSTLEESGK